MLELRRHLGVSPILFESFQLTIKDILHDEPFLKDIYFEEHFSKDEIWSTFFPRTKIPGHFVKDILPVIRNNHSI